MGDINRRTFLAGATAATVSLAAGRRARAAGANDTVVLALMGANNRGSQLAQGFAKLSGVEFAYVCDCDERAIAKGNAAAGQNGGRAPQGIKDFRQALDDPNVDGLVCAAPNHWHAAATLLACAAGKHVYVEKPASHTAEEGERMIAAARAASRVVQVGMQRRSGSLYQALVERVRDGAIGRVLYAKSWYQRNRPSIGRSQATSPPPWLDYSLWQGPAPERPFRENILHYNWHHFWHWGNAEIGNNGVHTIDICRWAMDVDFPSKVSVAGSKLRYDDDQETPDTMTATFECGDRVILWEGVSWSPSERGSGGIGFELRGENGFILADDKGFTIFDAEGTKVSQEKGNRGDAEHLQNFLDAVRGGTRPNAEIEEGHKSALLCHVANIAHRTGQPVETDAANGHIKDNSAAAALWSREYREGWMPKA